MTTIRDDTRKNPTRRENIILREVTVVAAAAVVTSTKKMIVDDATSDAPNASVVKNVATIVAIRM